MARSITLKRGQHYSPLRYPGGKAALSGFLGERIESLGLSDSTYVEPYAGGAGAALTLLMHERVHRIVINDLDPAIYSIWQAAVFESDDFIEKIRKTPVSLAQWHKQRKIYLRGDKDDTLSLGFATFFLNRVNRSGIVQGWPIGGIEQKGKWKIDARYNKDGLIARIQQIARYRDRISVSNLDALKLLKRQLKKSNVFTYLDPPYFSKGGSLYLNHYVDKDHQQLANVLNSNPEAAWLLTYDNVPQIKKLFPDRRKHGFSLSYSAYEKRMGSELMIFSDSTWRNWRV